MATAADQVRRLMLPPRIQAKIAPSDGCLARLALADRIADLPGIVTVDKVIDKNHFSVNVFVQLDSGSPKRQATPIHFCSINHDGLEIFGLVDADKAAIVSNAWGKLETRHVLVFLPRDDAEVEVCWRILSLAYERLTELASGARRTRAISPWARPYFSRSKLQQL